MSRAKAYRTICYYLQIIEHLKKNKEILEPSQLVSLEDVIGFLEYQIYMLNAKHKLGCS